MLCIIFHICNNHIRELITWADTSLHRLTLKSSMARLLFHCLTIYLQLWKFANYIKNCQSMFKILPKKLSRKWQKTFEVTKVVKYCQKLVTLVSNNLPQSQYPNLSFLHFNNLLHKTHVCKVCEYNSRYLPKCTIKCRGRSDGLVDSFPSAPNDALGDVYLDEITIMNDPH